MKKNSETASSNPRNRCRSHRATAGFAAILLAWSAPPLAAENDTASNLDLSPVVRFSHSTTNGWELQALGPFVHVAQDTPNAIQALPRPLFVGFDNGQTNGFDLLWPLVESRNRLDGRRLRALTYLHTRKADDDTVQRKRDWLIPVAFAGTDNDGTPYAALFPVWGRIHDVAGLDSMSFHLFPLHLRTRKNATESQTWLWPIFSRTTGPAGVDKWRVFPIYGERQDGSGDNHQAFALWPIAHWRHARTETRRADAWFVFPLIGHSREIGPDTTRSAASTTILWPLFLFAKTPETTTVNAPWPIFQMRTTDDQNSPHDKLYIWPAWGRSGNNSRNYQFFAWPFFHQWHRATDAESVDRTWLMPLYRHQRRTLNDITTDDSLQLWPLFKRSRNENGEMHLQTLALWPLAKNRVIDRLFTPLYTIFDYRHHENGNSHWSLLWNTAHGSTTEHGHEFSIPLLFHWHRNRNTARFSLLHGLITLDTAKNADSKLLYFFNF